MQRRSFIKLVLGGAASLALPWQPKAAAKPKTLADALLEDMFNGLFPSGPLHGQVRLVKCDDGAWFEVLSEKFLMKASASASEWGSLTIESDGEVVIPIELDGYWKLDRLAVFDAEDNQLFITNMDLPQAVSNGCTVNVGAGVTLL